MKKDQAPKFPVYRVVSYGKDVEFTPDLKVAEYAFKDCSEQVTLYEVQQDGSAKCIKQKA